MQSQSGHFKYQRGASPSGEAAMTGTMLHLIKWLPLGLIWTIRLSCDTSYSYQSGLLIHLLSIPQRESSPVSLLLVSSHHVITFSIDGLSLESVLFVFRWFPSVVIDSSL